MTNPFFYHGHVTHPDLWLMWYAIWFAAVGTLFNFFRIWRWLHKHAVVARVSSWGWSWTVLEWDCVTHYCAHIGLIQIDWTVDE